MITRRRFMKKFSKSKILQINCTYEAWEDRDFRHKITITLLDDYYFYFESDNDLETLSLFIILPDKCTSLSQLFSFDPYFEESDELNENPQYIWNYFTEVIIPEGIEQISGEVFPADHLDHLISIHIPTSLKSWTNDYFVSVDNIYISSVKDWCQLENEKLRCDSLFIGNSSIEHLDVPSNTIVNNKCAFANNNVTSITIESNVTYNIPDYQYFADSNLKNVKSYSSIPEDLFRNQNTIEHVYIDANRIGEGAFYSCDALKTVELFNVTSINGYVFKGCSNLYKVICHMKLAPDLTGYSYANVSVFANNKSGRKIYIPVNSKNGYINSTYWNTWADDIIEILDENDQPTYPYNDQLWLQYANEEITKISYDDIKTEIASYEFSENKYQTLEQLWLSDSIHTIGQYAFSSCSNLTTLYMPHDFTTSDTSTSFTGCTKLLNIHVPDLTRWATNGQSPVHHRYDGYVKGTKLYLRLSDGTSSEVKTISDNKIQSVNYAAFLGFKNITSITLNNVTTIGEYAFYGCLGLSTVTLGKYVTNIDNQAFRYCKTLTRVNISALTPPTLGANVFDGHSNVEFVIKPDIRKVDTYKAAEGWSEYADYIKIPIVTIS